MEFVTSPISILYPLILTCSSILPINIIVPSLFHFAKSPVLYRILLPNGLETNFSSVKLSLLRYPLETPSPAIHNSPGIPIPDNLLLFNIYI